MPFKGDMRLGGPHDNGASLNGTTEEPSVPPAGFVLRSETTTYPIAQGGTEATVSPTNLEAFVVPTQNAFVYVKADGFGGEYYDWATATNLTYKPAGELIMTSGYVGNSYVDINGTSYLNGGTTNDIVHDGYGGIMSGSGSTSYYSQGTFIYSEEAGVYVEYNNNNYQVGTMLVGYYHDGSGSYYTSNGSATYYSYGVHVGTSSYTSYDYIQDSGWGYQYQTGTGNTAVYSDGNGGTYTEGGDFSYTSEGTYIGQNPYNGYYYYDGQYGAYYSTSNAPYGTPTGNTSSGDLYYNINGSDYVIGSYSCNVYHDGNGSTYDADCGNSYYSYGTYITNSGEANWYSDGQGGVYSDP